MAAGHGGNNRFFFVAVALRNIAIAGAAVVVAALVRLLFLSALEARITWVTYYPAIMIASLFGGFYTGALAAILSCLVVIYGWPIFIEAPFIKDYGDWLGLAVYLLNCLLIAAIAEATHRARRSADQARQQAEAANIAKSVFLANMSHELRTPLNAILGFSSLMRNDPGLTEEQRQNLDIINESGEHLLNLINDVLDLAKVEAGRISIEQKPFDLEKLVEDVTTLLRNRAAAKGLQLFLDKPADFPRFIQADSDKLRQILINLLGNAIKYTVQGSVTLLLAALPGTDPEQLRLVMTVKDTGLGISATDQERIFEPFVQVGRHTTEKGTGLGLAITRRYIELMGGSISVASTPGKGSAFRVDLPVTKLAGSSLKAAATDRKRVVALAGDQDECRVLIVEDQVANWMLLKRTLASVGFKVRVAQNGAEGVEIFQQWKPHFIWMDCRMPVLDGLEASRRIRALEGGRNVKIVALTASVFKEERERVIAAGMDDLVRKPFHVHEIYECMEQHLGVRFIYDERTQTPAVSNSSINADINQEALSHLPQGARDELINALVNLDTAGVAAAIRRIEDLDAALGNHISEYAGRYQYSKLLEALKISSQE